MLDIRIRIKGSITIEQLETMLKIASTMPDMGWNYNWDTKKHDNIANYDSWEEDGYCYQYRVNLGHELITFFKITK